LIINAINDNTNTLVYDINSTPFYIKSKYQFLSGNYIIEDKKEVDNIASNNMFTTGFVFLRSNNTVL